MGGSGGFRFLWLLGGELDELEEDELDELERVLGWQGCFHPNRSRPRKGLPSVSYYLVRADNWKGDCGRDWARGRGPPGGRAHGYDVP